MYYPEHPKTGSTLYIDGDGTLSEQLEVCIPWSGSNWCPFFYTLIDLGLPDGTSFFISLSCHLLAVYICFVRLPNTGTRFVIMDMSVTMYQRQNSTTPDHRMSPLLTRITPSIQKIPLHHLYTICVSATTRSSRLEAIDIALD